MIAQGGATIYGGNVSYHADFQADQPGVNFSTITFNSGLDSEVDQLWALNISWLNPLVGAVKLIMRPNGVALPASSGSQRDGYNATTKLREDDSFTDLVIAELQAGQANTWVMGSIYFSLKALVPARIMQGRGVQFDKTATVTNWRVTDRIGFYNDNTTKLTSLQILTDTGTQAIGFGSRFFLYKI